jgi:CspA family cold shock protein
MRTSLFSAPSHTVALVRLMLACLMLCTHVGNTYAQEAPAAPASPTLTGTVKWFNDPKGYGFIVPDDGGDDVYVHHSRIETEGFRTLKKGDRVRFMVTVGRKFREASNVELIPDENRRSPSEPSKKAKP